jgi:DNA-binding IclR family transcriptional regulator
MTAETAGSVGVEVAADLDRTGVREVKSAARTVELLELLAARRNAPARLRELSDELGAPRSSVYALLRTLVDRGWVRTDPTGTLYSIGIQALIAGTTYLDVDPLLRIIQPQVSELSTRLDETIHYGRLQGTEIVYLATHESTQYVRPYSRVGRRLPAYATAMGKAILAARLAEGGPGAIVAHLPTELTALTARTITDRRALLAELEATAIRGYAIDDEENVLGLRCFALALRLGTLRPGRSAADAVSCSVPLERLAGREDDIVAAIRGTVATIERMVPLDG